MKKIFKLLLLITILLPFCNVEVFATNNYIKTSTNSLKIQRGYKGSFKITLVGSAGTVSVSSDNEKVATAALSSNTVFLDEESATCYITTKQNGSAVITVNYNIAHYDDERDYQGTLKVAVKVYTPTPVVSSDTTIKSIVINDEEIFEDEQGNYKVYFPLNTTTFTAIVNTNNEDAKVSEIVPELTEGDNEVLFTVTAEDGTTEDYIINAYVDEKPDIYYLDNTVGVVKNLDKIVVPEGFTEKQININEEKQLTIFSYQNLNLIYLMDGQGNKDYYVYDIFEDDVLSIYSPIIIDGHQYIKVNYDETTIEEIQGLNSGKIFVSNVSIKCYYFAESNLKDFCLVYLMNEKGEEKLYRYDMVENTIQRYVKPVEVEQVDVVKVVVISSLAAIGGILIIALIIANNEKKKEN